MTTAQILDDIHDGRVRTIEVARADQAGFRYLVEAEDVLEMAARLRAGSRLRQLADELGEPYDKIRQYINRHPALSCEERDGGHDQYLPDEIADHVRSYFTAQHALAERAIRMPEVAKGLGICVASVKTLMRHGELEEDARFHGGVQSVTRASLESYLRRGRRRLRSGR